MNKNLSDIVSFLKISQLIFSFDFNFYPHKEYIETYYCGIDDDMNKMGQLVKFCETNGDQFAEKNLDYENIDIELLKYFLDLSMPSISNYSYGSRILFNSFSKVVNEPEEAFAYLVFENNFKRWIYQAEATR